MNAGLINYSVGSDICSHPASTMDTNQTNGLHQIQPPPFPFNPNSQFRRDMPPRSHPSVAMDQTDFCSMGDFMEMGTGMGMWSAPTPQKTRRPRPMTIHETGFSYCMPQEYASLQAWNTNAMPLPIEDDAPQQMYSANRDFYTSSPIDCWAAKTCDESMDMQAIDTEMTLGQTYTTDENVPILDLRYSASRTDCDPQNPETPYNRRFSGSSFTMSTTGPLSEMPSYEDFSGSLSEAQSFISDYPPRSNRNSLLSSTQLSPVASPRMTPQNRSELVRTQSRGRASPSPRPSMRSAPYSIDSGRGKRWSTGSYAPALNRRPSPFVYHHTSEALNPNSTRPSSRNSSPIIPPHNQIPLNMSNLQTHQHPFLISATTAYQQNGILLPSHTYSEPMHFQNPPPLLSHGLFRMLQSNAEPNPMHSHYSDFSDPPDLYASLSEQPLDPPESDMNPDDPDMMPHEQELRFDGDLYTPRWVRGHGNKREGWCGICKPGRWLVLKNSAFWYDKSFTHGISAATGVAFEEPLEKRRMDGNMDVWEGLCGSCGEWVALISSKKKGTTWFRHAYKCHTHPKVKDAPKRRRESGHVRGQTTAMKVEASQPPMTTTDQSSSGTPTPTLANALHRCKEETISSPADGSNTMI